MHFASESPAPLQAPDVPAIVREDLDLFLSDLEPEERPEMLRGLCAAFDEEAAFAQQNLSIAAKTMDSRLLSMVVRKIGGTSRSVGARALADQCEKVERLIELTSHMSALKYIPQIQSEIERVQFELGHISLR